jgi:hypothetical protein
MRPLAILPPFPPSSNDYNGHVCNVERNHQGSFPEPNDSVPQYHQQQSDSREHKPNVADKIDCPVKLEWFYNAHGTDHT